ncbi:hypothetical protein MRB53_041397 [Persea americana]|nr:hypothetical protein MRB53_041397 [Persea americana]
MGRIIGIQHLDRLPPTLTRPQVVPFERETRQQHGERQALRVHPSPARASAVRGVHSPDAVVADVMMNALKGRESALKAGYRCVAKYTPNAPTVRPPRPPITPPSMVTLSSVSSGLRGSQWSGTCCEQPPPPLLGSSWRCVFPA